MTHRERLVIISILLLIAVAATTDIITDSREGVAVWHLLIEGAVGLFALFGVFYLIKDIFNLRHDLDSERRLSANAKVEAEQWRSRSKKYLQGLSNSIEEQLSRWKLSPAEKEVAFLLLKGMSLKEIAHLRKTTEKTARVQSMAVYSKAGLTGRSELAAYFLEDLLPPIATGDPQNPHG